MSICILTCITIIYVYFCRNTNHLFRKSVKRYSARFTLFLSVRERAMDIIGYNYLKTIRKLHSKNCLFVQHLLARNLLASSADENSIRFRLLFPLNCITLRSSIFSIFLLRREVICRTTFYLLPLSTDQSESFIGTPPCSVLPVAGYLRFLWTDSSNRYISSQEKYYIVAKL